ncbi:hypothetical protein [Aliivibrio logei]|uniref:hypothetical protein n=1 Tax=Aliivibrio logei TaxID=688 RepID=UPI00039E2D6F|nr:hypothetical protein [Aliivibrio logei]
MDKKTFARQISSYIDFNTIRKTLASYDKNKDEVLEQSCSFFGSPSIKNAQDWELYALVSEYLKEFRIPEETIDLLVKIDGTGVYSNEAIKWLKNYKFSGKVIGNPDINDPNLPFKPIIVAVAESGIIEIIHWPLNFIFSAVENFSATWREAEKHNIRAFLEPNSPSELFVYLEQRVASHYKYMDKTNAGSSAGNAIFNGYRYVCLTHELKLDINLLNLAEESAIQQANGTMV